jgi:hypothetical protein
MTHYQSYIDRDCEAAHNLLMQDYTSMTRVSTLYYTIIKDTTCRGVSFFKSWRCWVCIPPTSLLELMHSTTIVSSFAKIHY